jgi:hypothetical protein
MPNSSLKLTPAQELLLTITNEASAHMAASLHYCLLCLPGKNHSDHITNIRWIKELLEKRSREIADKLGQEPDPS